MATGFHERNGGLLRPPQPPSSPRAATTTPRLGTDLDADKLKQLVAARHQQEQTQQAKTRRQRRENKGMYERLAAVVVEPTGRETAAAAAVETGAEATAAGGGPAPALISQAAVVEALASAVETEVEAQPSSSSSFAKLKDNTDQLFLAVKGLDSTAKAVAAAAAAEKASVAAGAAVAAWAASERLNEKVDEQNRIVESSSQRVTEEVESWSGMASKTKVQRLCSWLSISTFLESARTSTRGAVPQFGHDICAWQGSSAST